MENQNNKIKQNKKQQQPQQTQNSTFSYPILDYSIKDEQERNKIVHQIVNTIPKEKLTPYYLEKLTQYLVIEDKVKKDKTILTDNRLVTINKRETSLEGIVAKMENGEDNVYNLFIEEGDKNVLLVPKLTITQQDIDTIPGMRELREAIEKIQTQRKKATGQRRYLLIKQLIELRQQQYALKYGFKPITSAQKAIHSFNQIRLNDQHITIDKNGEPVSDGLISLFNPEHISALLCNYSKLKEQSEGRFENDLFYLMLDLDAISEAALKEQYPILYSIMIYKIDGLTNKEILDKLKEEFDSVYSLEYLSALWRNKIPKLIAERAKRDWIVWHYTMEEKGKWKRCSRCHEIKLAHPYFFTKNNTSKDGYYSLCKECRNKKK